MAMGETKYKLNLWNQISEYSSNAQRTIRVITR